jgi:bacteriorhodopsin
MEHYVFSFYLTYILLLTTATITFIEAIKTKIVAVQHIMNLETCISLIGSYFYYVFNEKIKNTLKKKQSIDWREITQLRYIDWSITTPFMLLVLSLVLSFNSKTKIKLPWFAAIVFFNYVMLFFGYMGETGRIERMIADSMGFIAFFITFGIIFMQYVLPRFNLDNYILFGGYVFLWGLYGIAYNFTEINKNILMNYLDLTSKCFVGIGLWIYYAKIIRFA